MTRDELIEETAMRLYVGEFARAEPRDYCDSNGADMNPNDWVWKMARGFAAAKWEPTEAAERERRDDLDRWRAEFESGVADTRAAENAREEGEK